MPSICYMAQSARHFDKYWSEILSLLIKERELNPNYSEKG